MFSMVINKCNAKVTTAALKANHVRKEKEGFACLPRICMSKFGYLGGFGRLWDAADGCCIQYCHPIANKCGDGQVITYCNVVP